jgi:predicted RNA binding protein YcfA (HicA-like mRNA interferase family)
MAKNADEALERNSRKLMKLLINDGWIEVRCNGSHHTMKKTGVKHPITLIHPRKDLPVGLVRKIYKDAGWL